MPAAIIILLVGCRLVVVILYVTKRNQLGKAWKILMLCKLVTLKKSVCKNCRIIGHPQLELLHFFGIVSRTLAMLSTLPLY